MGQQQGVGDLRHGVGPLAQQQPQPPPLVPAVCAAAVEPAMRSPMATNAVIVICRDMGYLTKKAPEGALDPWMFRWHLAQARPMNREFTVG